MLHSLCLQIRLNRIVYRITKHSIEAAIIVLPVTLRAQKIIMAQLKTRRVV